MPNDVKLQSPEGTHPLDENLRPLKIGDKTAPLELSNTDVRVNNLQVSGTTTGVTADSDDTKLSLSGGTMTGDITTDSNIVSTDAFLLDSEGSITIDTNASSINFAKDGDNVIQVATTSAPSFKIWEDISGGVDYFQILLGPNGVTTIRTVDVAGDAADLSIDIDGDITLDSYTGKFIAKKNGTEFSPANSSYSGMLLGCTHVFGSGTGGVFQLVGTAWESLLWDTDKYALVTFVVPPSNKVKISVHFPYIAAASYAFQLGLATDSSATSLGNKYANDVDDANRADSFNINYSWVVEGSDHSWSAGETKTLYIMAYAATNIRFYTGGTNAGGYGGVIVEATALPATIGDGSEP